MRVSMHRPWSAGAFIGVAVLLLLSACQTDGMTDSGGRGVQVTEWKTIDVSEVDLNLPLLLSQKVTKVEYQIRDNSVYHHRLRLDYGKGLVFTEHVPTAWYGFQSEIDLKDIEKFKSTATKSFGKDFEGFGEVRAIKRHGMKTLGYATVVDVKNPSIGKCFFAHVGYRVKPPTYFDNDVGNIDTFVVARYCDPKVSIDDFAYALEHIDRVKDRAKFKAELAAK